MSIPLAPIKLLKEGRVIGELPCTASYSNTQKIADGVRWLMNWHEWVQNDWIPNSSKLDKSYDAMSVRWIGGSEIVWSPKDNKCLVNGEEFNV